MVKRLIAIVFLMTALLACHSEEHKRELEAEVRASLDRYLTRLVIAYREGNATVMKGVASQKEHLEVGNLIMKLYERGYLVDAELVDLQIVYMDVYNETNAFVKTTEIWDVTTRHPRTREVKGKQRGQLLHVTYQISDLPDLGWVVTSRLTEETRNNPDG